MPAKRPNNPARELLFGDLWEYDPAPETAPAHIAPRYDLFINGKFTAPKSKKWFDSISPGDEKKVSEIALAKNAHGEERSGADVVVGFEFARFEDDFEGRLAARIANGGNFVLHEG